MNTALSADRLLTAAEAAELLGVRESWVRAHTREGDFPSVSIGRYKRYRLEDVRAYVERQAGGRA
jgi:excisionase family DNA binding protein